MEHTGLMGGFYRLSEWITRLAYVNLLWILFSLLGGILLGVVPATVALFTVTRRWVRNDEDVPVFDVFWQAYRSNFIKSNLLGLVLAFGGAILFVYFDNLHLLPAQLTQILRVVLFSFILLYGIIIVFIFPVYVHYKVGTLHYIKNALIIGLTFPHYAIVMILSLALLTMLFQFVPILIFVFGGSFSSLLIMSLAYNVFKKIEIKQKEKDNEEKDKERQVQYN
ncbi:YesL family protein [Oceanobacillus rekensis]|uniref:YesL family protein n=1 Tax=Oceanobacillus rekensis TaxID=937927 RepID=UPI000B451734|nr:YesL family protein [Oceanobacillus rekensis]